MPSRRSRLREDHGGGPDRRWWESLLARRSWSPVQRIRPVLGRSPRLDVTSAGPAAVSYPRPMATNDDVDAYVAAGLFDPAADADTGRLDLLRWLEQQGFAIEELSAAFEAGALGAVAGDRRLVPGERLSRSEAIALSGMEEAGFDENVRALGFSPIAGAPPGEIGVTAAEAKTMAVFEALGQMFSPDEATAFLRVVGSSLSRIADAAVSVFLSDVESRSISAGESELVLAQKVYDAVGLLDGFPETFDPVLRRHVLQSIERTRRTTISLTERLEYRYAIGFVDLVGFTEVSRSMATAELSVFLRDFEGRAYDVVTSAGARVVKLIGDEVMFVSSDPSAACTAASELMDGFGAEHDRILPRAGLAYGDVLVRGGDFYGPVVNLASRLVDEAVPQELLVTEEFALAAPDCDFEPAGRRMVKGFADPVRVRSLGR